LTVAVSCTVCVPTTVAGDGETVIEPTGTWSTKIVDVPLFPSLVAVITAVPAATPVTTPPVETVATAVALELQVTTRPVRVLPPASFVIAVSVCVAPTNTLADDGLTATVATGTGTTVTVAVPDFPSLVAVMTTVPSATPLTMPPTTVATAVLAELQLTARPVSTTPFASLGIAVRMVDVPITTLGV